jgi:hypothetical protein
MLITVNALVESVNRKISFIESSRETDVEDQSLGRGLLGIVLFTWTETSTTTISHTCTTSTSSLKSCTGVYLRKRAISLGRRRLLYDEQDDDSEDGSAFLPLPEKYFYLNDFLVLNDIFVICI